jgi:cytochrome c553
MALAVVLLAVVLLPTTVLGDAKAGKAVYDKKCASCHGANGEGKPALAKALKVEIRDLGSKEVQAKTDAQLKKESVEGVGKMKAVAGLSDQEVKDLLEFIRSLKK